MTLPVMAPAMGGAMYLSPAYYERCRLSGCSTAVDPDPEGLGVCVRHRLELRLITAEGQAA